MRKTLMLALLTGALLSLTSSRPLERTFADPSVIIVKPPIDVTVPVSHTFTMLGCKVTISGDIIFKVNNNFQIYAVGFPKVWDIKVDCSTESENWQRPGTDVEFIVKDGVLTDAIFTITNDSKLDAIYADPDFKHNVLKAVQDAQPQPK
jgi:hypothetical protein